MAEKTITVSVTLPAQLLRRFEAHMATVGITDLHHVLVSLLRGDLEAIVAENGRDLRGSITESLVA